MIAFHVQTVYQPFTVEKLNRLEQMSILTAAITIYCGLLYLTEKMDEVMKLILFAWILITNALFLTTWLKGLLEAYAVLLVDKKPKIARKICCCFLKSRQFRKL